MNPIDHPNGGRAKTVQPEKSPWNWIAKKKNNNVAKSAWKFLRTNQIEIYMYNIEFKLLLKQQGYQSLGFVKNNHMINNINHTFKCWVHLGKYTLEKNFYSHSIKSKVGEFLKFTKPFYFYSKKKNKNKC